ncbi:MAG: hypothetical protein Q9160_000961 [Pyrenula sp. 1 TL-2023]
MAIPNAALQKLLQEVESQALLAQQQINVVKSQLSAKQREARLIQLTTKEIGQLPQTTQVFEGVGKMFVASPKSTVNKRLSDETSSLKGEITGLEKRLHYLETTHKNSREHINKILQTGGR